MTLQLSIAPHSHAPMYQEDAGHLLVEWYHDCLSAGQTTLPTADSVGALPASVASVVLRAIMEYPAAYTVTLVCKDEAEAALYRQMYNFWFAGTKEERL